MVEATVQLPEGGADAFLAVLKVMVAATVYHVDAAFYAGSALQCVVVDAKGACVCISSADAVVSHWFERRGGCHQPKELVEVQTGSAAEVEQLAAQLAGAWGAADGRLLADTEIVLFSTLWEKQRGYGWAPNGQLGRWFSRLSADPAVSEGLQRAVAFAEKTLVFPPHRDPTWFTAFSDPCRRLREIKTVWRGDKVHPRKGERNVLVTSALPYVNNVPHLGNIVGSVLSADVFARYSRARLVNTLFICGTDEYGTATETKALEQKVTPKELCDKYHKVHYDVYKWFEIEFDMFGRTTTQKQTEIASGIFMDLHRNGFLEEKTIRQLYCEKHEGFLADRYVQGSCPKCLYEDARGDQCDSCGQLLDPFELKEPKCKLDGEAPVERETKHIFMLLNKLQPQVEAWVKVSSEAGKWSANGISITSNFLKMGLEPRCITRDLKWGTPVPTEVPNMEGKVLYVWFDATIGYISITANYTENWSEWWNNPENVQLYQFMGKDNVPFHTIIFPATLIATNKKWTMLHHLSTTEYLKYEGGKFSKSRGVGVFGDNVQKTNIPSSVWRYYLLVSRPEVSDTMFSWAEFIQRNNSELLANLGNFVNRVVKFVNMKYGSLVPSYIQHPYTFDNGSGDDAFHGSSSDHLCFLELHRDINRILVQYIEHMDAVKIRYSLKLVFDFSSRGNLFLQTNRLNNALFDGNPQHCADVIGYMVNLIYLISACIAPFMPSTSRSIADQLNVPQRSIPDTWTLDILPGHRINKAYHLFSRIDEKMADFWRDSFGSS